MAKYEVCRTFSGKYNHLRLIGTRKTLCLSTDAWSGTVNGEDDAGQLCVGCYGKFTRYLDTWDRITDLSLQAAMLWIAEALRKGDVNPEMVSSLLYALVWTEGAHWRTNLRADVANDSVPL